MPNSGNVLWDIVLFLCFCHTFGVFGSKFLVWFFVDRFFERRMENAKKRAQDFLQEGK